jgi:hypothetical protein
MSIETAPGAGVGVRVRLPLTGDADPLGFRGPESAPGGA